MSDSDEMGELLNLIESRVSRMNEKHKKMIKNIISEAFEHMQEYETMEAEYLEAWYLLFNEL